VVSTVGRFPILILIALCVVAVFVLPPTVAAQDAEPTLAPHTSDAQCADCHADPHQETAEGTCESCHSTAHWTPTTFDLDRHAKTAFPLTGKHVDVPCASCHTQHKLTGQPTECAGCHVDRHRGTLGQDCTSCHSEAGFTPVANFDHSRTGFLVDGPHTGRACADCHQGAHGRSLSLLTAAATCTTCHTPRHGDLGQQCASCHQDAHSQFADAHTQHVFDHRTTGFDLERRHRAIPCRSCHPADGGAPQERCATCHTDPHAGQLTQKCDTCHQPDRWRLVRFDHDQTGHPLQGRHFVTPCIDCHTGQRWVGLTSTCWDCHAADAARAPKSIPAHGFGPSACQDCHMSWSW